MKTKLSVNLNKVALLRNQRDLDYPSVTDFARIVVNAGADGITVHPRPDERHARWSDVREIRQLLRTEFDDRVEFNVEGYPTRDFLDLIAEVQPTQVTLVPDAPEQRTSDHGWDLSKDGDWLRPIITDLVALGSRVSLFVDADVAMISRARDVGAQRIELYTEPFANAFSKSDYAATLARFAATAIAALDNNLVVNAGHDLTLENLPVFKAKLPMLAEVSVGHAITADALKVGFEEAVKLYLHAIK